MSERLTFVGFPYGTPDLKKSHQKYWLEAFALSILLHFIGIGSYWAIIKFLKRNFVPTVYPTICHFDPLKRSGSFVIPMPFKFRLK